MIGGFAFGSYVTTLGVFNFMGISTFPEIIALSGTKLALFYSQIVNTAGLFYAFGVSMAFFALAAQEKRKDLSK